MRANPPQDPARTAANRFRARGPSKGRARRRLAAFALSTALALALAEGLTRLALGPPEWVVIESRPPEELASSPVASEPRRLVGERRGPRELYVRTASGPRLQAGTEAIIQHHRLSGLDVEVRVNSLGLRNPELGPKLAGRPRVLFLGDSITLSGYLPEPQTWVRRVESLATEGGSALETVNAGIGAVGLECELALFSELADAVRPDLVVLGFYLNDAQDSPGVRVLHPPALLEWSWFVRYLCTRLPGASRNERISREERDRRLREIARACPSDAEGERDEFHREVRAASGDWGSAWSESAWERMDPLFAELERRVSFSGGRLAILCFPVRQQVEAASADDRPTRRLARVAQRLEVPFLDLLPALREARRASRAALFFDQCHHTAHGSEVVARAVWPFVLAALR